MSARFFLASPQLDRSSIDVIVRHEGKRYKRGIKTSVETKYWNHEKQRASVTQTYREGGEINTKLHDWSTAIDRVIHKSIMNRVDISDQSIFWKMVECERRGVEYKEDIPEEPYFVDYFEKVYLRRFLTTKSETRITRFKVIIKKLRDFEEHAKRRYKFSDIGLPFYRDLQNYMNGLQHSANYFGTTVKIIKQVMKEAHLIDKLHNNMEFMHSDFKATSQEVDTIYLTEKEIQKIADTEIGQDFIDKFYPRAYPATAQNVIRSYNVAKSRFLIGAVTGLRMSDFNSLRKENINGNMITVITEKTDQKIVVPIHPILRKILDNGFDFSETLSDDKTRKYMKDICKYAGLGELIEVRESIGGKTITNTYPKWKLVGTHTARRSFATNAYKAGVPTLSIMKITGHTKESTFMRYIRISEEENAEILANHTFFGGGKEEKPPLAE